MSGDAVRNGQQAVLAVDAIALLDALGVDQAIVAGFDWGARTANVMAALWPERCRAMVSVSGYLIGSQAAGQAPLPPDAERAWWYQYYFATERGRAGYAANRDDFARLIWRSASPAWRFDDATFERSAAAFDNPDHVAVVIHNYRWRIGLAAGEPELDALEQRLAAFPAISVPTITLEGDANGAPHPEPAAYASPVHRQVRAPDTHRRHRPQPAAGGAARLRPRDRRGRRLRLIREERAEMTSETTTTTAGATAEEKISQLRELFADAPEVGKKALENVLGQLKAQASQKPPPPVQSAGRVGSRLGKVSELTIIVPFAPGGAQRLRAFLKLFGGNLAGADDVGTVHDMRFVFLDNDTRMLFATAYDGDWDAYIDDFATKIPDFLDIIDSAWEGWPGIRSPQAKDYLAKYQVTAEGWYVANDLTVAETRRLRRIGQAADQFLDAVGDQ